MASPILFTFLGNPSQVLSLVRAAVWRLEPASFGAIQGVLGRAQSATTSELEGVGPSAPRPPRCISNDRARDRDAQQARMELHLRSQAWRALT